MKKIILTSLAIIIAVGMYAMPKTTKADELGSKLSGRILLAVQTNGESWYVNPVNLQRYYLGRPMDAFNIMRQLGLGISNKDFNALSAKAPGRLSGRILLKVEDHGMAYYVNPTDLKLYFLGRPDDAFKIMREKSLGITNSDLNRIISATGSTVVSLKDSTFKPENIIVKKGAMVTWTNNDSITHAFNATSTSGNFNSTSIQPNTSFSRIFSLIGTYKYQDTNNSDMTGTIIVE